MPQEGSNNLTLNWNEGNNKKKKFKMKQRTSIFQLKNIKNLITLKTELININKLASNVPKKTKKKQQKNIKNNVFFPFF